MKRFLARRRLWLVAAPAGVAALLIGGLVAVAFPGGGGETSQPEPDIVIPWLTATVTPRSGQAVLPPTPAPSAPAASSPAATNAPGQGTPVQPGGTGQGIAAEGTVTAGNAVTPVVVTPGPTATLPAGAVRRITVQDNQQTIHLRVGETFLLALGDSHEWTVNVSDQDVLSRVPNVLVVRGAQGIYKANKPGEAVLTATGDPPCRQATPPCALPSIAFRLTVIVDADR